MSEPTVLGMINDKLTDISSDVKEIKTELKESAIKAENHDVRLIDMERDVKEIIKGQKKIKKDLYDHIADKKTHYNQGYKETIPQKVIRKRWEISVITIITTVIGWLVNNYLGS